MTSIDTVIETIDTRKGRKQALAAARAAFARGKFGAECKVRYDTVVYVVCRDGIHRLEKGPAGQTFSDRRIP